MVYSFDLVGSLWYGGTRGNRGRLLLNATTSSIIVGCKEKEYVNEILLPRLFHSEHWEYFYPPTGCDASRTLRSGIIDDRSVETRRLLPIIDMKSKPISSTSSL